MRENPIIHVSYDSSGIDESVLVCMMSKNWNHYMVSGKIGEQADEVYRIVSNQDGLNEHDNKVVRETLDYLVQNGYIKYGFNTDYLIEQMEKNRDGSM